MTVTEIIADWLKTHGYDGLARENCGCPLDDLILCDGGIPESCEAAHHHVGVCKDCPSAEWYEQDDGGGCFRTDDAEQQSRTTE